MLSGRTNQTAFRRTILMVFGILGITSVLAHSINAIVEHELVATPALESATLQPVGPSPAVDDASLRDVDFIKNSGLFEMPASPVWSTEPDLASAPPKPPLEAAKKVRLIGLVLSDHRPAAVLEDIASKQQSLFHLHEEVPGIGELRSITRDGVVIGQDDQEELLPLAILSEDSAHSLSPAHTLPSVHKPFGPPIKRILDRREAAQAVSDPAQLKLQAHAVPSFANGRPNGVRLDFVLPSGFFDKAGFQYGDVIQRINGVEIRDPDKTLALFKELLNERVVKVEVVRHNQPTIVTYELL
ncbi:MAG: hypothetical protein NZM29_00080 [Nitrospira sp.]|nr:hypothetical protein [Nitrospira sp.]